MSFFSFFSVRLLKFLDKLITKFHSFFVKEALFTTKLNKRLHGKKVTKEKKRLQVLYGQKISVVSAGTLISTKIEKKKIDSEQASN